MLYTVAIVNGESVALHEVEAQNTRQAHDLAETLHQGDAKGIKIRVYPDTRTELGLTAGALMVARRTAAHAIMRTGGNETQAAIDSDLKIVNAKCHNTTSANRIVAAIRECNQDTQDFFGYASMGLSEARRHGLGIPAQYAHAYSVLNKYIRSQRAASTNEISLEYIIDGNGDLISINRAVSAILSGSDKYIPAGNGVIDEETAMRLGEVLSGAFAGLSEIQKDIAKLMGMEYSQSLIADKVERAESTVKQHIANIRVYFSEYVHEHAPEFEHMINAKAVALAKSTTANKGKRPRTEEGKASARAYVRAYKLKEKRFNSPYGEKWRESYSLAYKALDTLHLKGVERYEQLSVLAEHAFANVKDSAFEQ